MWWLVKFWRFAYSQLLVFLLVCVPPVLLLLCGVIVVQRDQPVAQLIQSEAKTCKRPQFKTEHKNNSLNLNRCFAETTSPRSPPDINNLERSTTTQTWRQHYSIMQPCKVNHAERILPLPLHIQSVWAARGGWGYSNREIRVLGLWGKCVELWGWSAFQ